MFQNDKAIFWLDTRETVVPWSQYLFNTHQKLFGLLFSKSASRFILDSRAIFFAR